MNLLLDSALLLARLSLAFVFGAAGLAKLANLNDSSRALVNFGLPLRLAILLGKLLPITELAVAVALVPLATAWWGALGALSLTLVFIVAIAINLALGRTPECNCFGQLHSSPISWRTLIRNSLLAGMAGFVVWQGQFSAGLSVVEWLSDLTPVQIASLVVIFSLVAAVAVEGWFLLHLLRQHGRLLTRINSLERRVEESSKKDQVERVRAEIGLPVGSRAPAFELTGLKVEKTSLDWLRKDGKSVLLVFTDPDCDPCKELLSDIASWQREQADKLAVTLISRGKRRANRAMAEKYGLSHVLIQKDDEVARAYHVIGTPTAVLIREDGSIGSSLAEGSDAIRSLLAGRLRLVSADRGKYGGRYGPKDGKSSLHPAALKIGKPAPHLRMPDLEGNMVDLSGMRGSPVLLLFWNPRCGFCDRMLKDLRAWEANRFHGYPQMLVVSSGTVEDNRSLNLKSPIIIDPGFEVGRAFGVNGTPAAVLVDIEGRIASLVATGPDDVLELTRTGQTQGAVEGAPRKGQT